MEEELKGIEKMKEIPKDVKKKINNKVYESILISAIIMLICVLLLFGCRDLAPDLYLKGLKILSMIALFITLFLLEYAYKKDSAKLTINAVEAIVLSICLLSFPYMYIYYWVKCPAIITFISAMSGVYYSLKGAVIIFVEKRKYRRSVSDLENIEK